MSTETQSTKVITGLVRFSYAKVWNPEAMEEGGDKKYSVAILIPKSDSKTIDLLRKAIDVAKEQGKSKWGGKIPPKLKLPLRDGDEERPDDDAYAGHYFLNATGKTKPGIVDKNRQPIMDQDEFYSGCYGHASINFYPFDTKGNKGVACGLNNLMKIKDGESLSGRVSAENDFAEFTPAEADDDLM